MKVSFRIFDGIFLAFAACCFIMLEEKRLFILGIPIAILYLLINIFPSLYNIKIKSFRLRVCAEGSDLLTSFLIAATSAVIYHIVYAIVTSAIYTWQWWVSAVIALLLLSVTFWNGIIRVYCTSVQLGIKHRVIGLLCGLIPFLNIWALCRIILITGKEVEFEHSKSELNNLRAEQQICKTKYPLLMVHGVFFRDYKYLNYWGRIPDELSRNGAVVFYGNHQSALPVKDSGAELAERIKEIVRKTGCEKVNVIAHSKGGLDCRYAISLCGADKYVASLTTINTPHRGCAFVDWLLTKVDKKIQNGIAFSYNSAMKRFGENPNFLAAVNDLTYKCCCELNEEMPDVDGILYQSVGSKLNKAVSGKFPLNLSYNFVRHFSGDNDGLVSADSFEWGTDFRYITVKGKRGISHADMVDLNRENIPDFDVREFYVQLVADLKNQDL